MVQLAPTTKTPLQKATSYLIMAIGAFLAAVSIHVFLYPNQLIDGGVIGLSLIGGRLFGDQYVPLFLIILNLPFIYLSYKHIRRSFVISMGIAVGLFAIFLVLTEHATPFTGDPIEIIALGGALLGIGVGLIIRMGACTDGTEILGIIINRKWGFTVGQVVLFINIFVFAFYGLIFKDWHIAVKSLLTYIVAFKMIDLVITGLDELKSVTIITSQCQKLRQAITEEMGLGMTILHGQGGYSLDDREILLVIVERLDLAELKEVVLRHDESAFMAIENMHEVVSGKGGKKRRRRRKRLS
ncbi:MAG: YitT family protein [Simkaniaceae bacterium]|nr:YitT family protein [Simkaniaceae bacterium]